MLYFFLRVAVSPREKNPIRRDVVWMKGDSEKERARGWLVSEGRDAKLPHSVRADVRVAEG